MTVEKTVGNSAQDIPTPIVNNTEISDTPRLPQIQTTSNPQDTGLTPLKASTQESHTKTSSS